MYFWLPNFPGSCTPLGFTETWQMWRFILYPESGTSQNWHRSKLAPVALAPHLKIAITDKACEYVIRGQNIFLRKNRGTLLFDSLPRAAT
jgi:hypothetical protein